MGVAVKGTHSRKEAAATQTHNKANKGALRGASSLPEGSGHHTKTQDTAIQTRCSCIGLVKHKTEEARKARNVQAKQKTKKTGLNNVQSKAKILEAKSNKQNQTKRHGNRQAKQEICGCTVSVC